MVVLTLNDCFNISAVSFVTDVFPFVPVTPIVNGCPIVFFRLHAITPNASIVSSQII